MAQPTTCPAKEEITVLGTPRLTDARILVVDDERVNVVLLERILDQDGYRNVKSVTDPSEAVGLYDQFEPDLVLLDLHMPKLDGFAVMKLLEERISSDTFLAHPDPDRRHPARDQA